MSVQGMAKRGGVDERLRALRYINRGGTRIRGDRRKEVLGQTEYTPTRTHTHIMKLLFISLTLSALLATASAAPLTSAAAAAADSSSSKVYRSIGDPMYRIRRDGLPPLLG